MRASRASALAAAAATAALRRVEVLDISQAMNSVSDYQLLETGQREEANALVNILVAVLCCSCWLLFI
jgi:hypothetical protein